MGSHNSGPLRERSGTHSTQGVRLSWKFPISDPQGSEKASTFGPEGSGDPPWAHCALQPPGLVQEVVRTGRVCTRPLSAVVLNTLVRVIYTQPEYISYILAMVKFNAPPQHRSSSNLSSSAALLTSHVVVRVAWVRHVTADEPCWRSLKHRSISLKSSVYPIPRDV